MPDYDPLIADLARKLRMGSSIVPVYKSLTMRNKPAFVYNLLKELYKARLKESALRNRSKAGFEQIKTLENYEFDNLELPKGFNVEWLKSGRFIADKQNLVLIGQPGTGKTHLAQALGVKACDEGQKVLFYRTSKLVELLVELHERNEMERFWRRLEKSSLLILDEWGYVPVHQTGTRLLFEVINECYERRSLVITTNLPVGEWNRIFGDDRLTAAMLDRIVHHGLFIKHGGESYRIRRSLMNA